MRPYERSGAAIISTVQAHRQRVADVGGKHVTLRSGDVTAVWVSGGSEEMHQIRTPSKTQVGGFRANVIDTIGARSNAGII